MQHTHTDPRYATQMYEHAQTHSEGEGERASDTKISIQDPQIKRMWKHWHQTVIVLSLQFISRKLLPHK